MTLTIRKNPIAYLATLLLLTFSFISCDQEDVSSISEIENFSDATIRAVQSSAVGKNYCLEFIFPISIQFIDESITEVTDYEDLHETVKAYFSENDLEKSKENKPSLVFPIEVVNQDGEIIQVEDEDTLKALKSECPKKGKCKNGKKGKGHKCFDLVFPINIVIDGETLSFEDKESLKTAIKTYKEAEGEDSVRPELVFPITVEYDNGSIVEVSSKDDLIALKEACKEE